MPLTEKQRELMKKTLMEKSVEELLAMMPEVEKMALAEKVRDLPVSVEGFKAFYKLTSGRNLPPAALHLWTPEYVNAYNNRTGVLLDCHRGATKTTFQVWWILYVQGKRPEGNTQLARISDDAAAETDRMMAGFIETNAGWKLCFPNIVPDPDQGWSSKGRFVKDTTVAYGEWRQKCMTDHLGEPNIQCCGITSGDIIGKHPSNGWYADDLHDEKNTRSQREMQTIVDVVEKNAIPTWMRPEGHPMLGVACTLWSDRDAYHAMLKTGLFKHVKTPIFVLDEYQYIQVGDEVVHPDWIDKYPVEVDINGKKIKSLWNEAYTGEKIREIQKSFPVYFPLMYLCDLSAAKGIVLKAEWLHSFPYDKISPNWPVYFGIDFASTSDRQRQEDSDFFALAILRVIPSGGAILVDGVRERLGWGEALEKVKALAAIYRPVMIGVEKWGSGEKFKDQLLFTSNLNIMPLPVKGTPTKSKGKRFEDELAPMFTTSRLWISDVETEFISWFKQEWVSWNGQRSATGHDDTLDGVYWGAHIAQGHLMPHSEQSELPVRPVQKQLNPYRSWQ
jgi:phage terminase large subunit-like protein